MKLKAVASSNLPPDLLAALNSTVVADAFREIVIQHLRVDPESFGPATHYVQESDLIIPGSDGKTGIEVTLSKVSVTDNRSPQDFRRALIAFRDFYTALIAEHLPVGEDTQLFCVLALDAAVKFAGEEPTSLVEVPSTMVEGRKVSTDSLWFNTKPAMRELDD